MDEIHNIDRETGHCRHCNPIATPEPESPKACKHEVLMGYTCWDCPDSEAK